MAKPGDEEAIAAVHLRTWQVAYRGQLPDAFLDALSMEPRIAGWRRTLADSSWPTKVVFVLEEGDRVIGFASTSPSRDDDAGPEVGELGTVYLLPDFWDRGWGRALLNRAAETMQTAGFSTATLWVLDANSRARRFYEAAGWTPDGATKLEDLRGFPLQEIRYRRALA